MYRMKCFRSRCLYGKAWKAPETGLELFESHECSIFNVQNGAFSGTCALAYPKADHHIISVTLQR